MLAHLADTEKPQPELRCGPILGHRMRQLGSTDSSYVRVVVSRATSSGQIFARMGIVIDVAGKQRVGGLTCRGPCG